MSDFDFLIGSWTVACRRLTERFAGSDDWDEFSGTSRCSPLFGGAANVEEVEFPTKGFSGVTLRLFDRQREEWSLHWADSTSGVLFPPVVGRFSDGVGVFHGDDTDGGRPVRVRFRWSAITPVSARWEQAFSADGASWETNWFMDLSRLA